MINKTSTFGRYGVFGFLIVLGVLAFGAPAQADNFQKAVSHYKNFEIREALNLFESLAKNASGSEKARSLLYAGLCHAYLRDREKAISAMKEAIKLDRSIGIPAQTPSRLRDLFNEARRQSGLSGDAPVARTEPPTTRTDPPVERRDPPPARRKISFGDFSFSVRRRPPPERRIEEPPPTRRIEEPPVRRIEEPPPRRIEEPLPPERRVEEPPSRRKVSARDPILPDGDKDPLTDNPETGKKKGGPNLMIILGGVSAGLAAALLGGAIFMGVRANGTLAIGKQQATYQVDIPNIQRDADGSALVSNILYGAAGAVAVGAVVFFILSPRFGAKKTASKNAALPSSYKDLPKARARGNSVLFSSTL